MRVLECDESGVVIKDYDDGVVTSYAQLRAIEYAQLNQDEMRYDDLINGTTGWQDTIATIKAKYPKPSA